MHSHTREEGIVRAIMPDGWYAVYTRHQHEKSAAELLTDKGFEVLLPLYQSTHRWKDRKQSVLLPLFRSYLFVRADLSRRIYILTTPGVCWLVGSGGQPTQLPDPEIEAVRKLVESPFRYQPHPFLNTGERVRVVKGLLCGLEGILTRVKNGGRVILSVELLRQSAAVEVDLDTLELINPSSFSIRARNN
jgi:transcription antitermination factor NusG